MESNNPEGIANEPLSLDEGIKAFAAASSKEVEPDQPEDEEVEVDDDAELPADEDEEDDGEQTDEDQAEDGEEEDDTEEGRFVAKNGKVRLPDGSVSTIEDLIQGNLRTADYTRKTQEAAAERKQVEEYRAVLSQYENQLAQARDLTVRILEAKMPKAPDDVLAFEDPVGYIQAKAQYERSLNEYQQYQHILSQERQHAELVQAREMEQLRARETNLMLEKVPELKDRERAPKVLARIADTAEQYGLSRDELMSITDHRVIVALRDLARMKAAQGEGKAKAQAKIANKPPVTTGSKRVHPAERRGREVDAAFQRLNQTGSIRDGVLALLASQKKGR